MLTGKADKAVVIEAEICLAANEASFTCGWPFDPKTKQPMLLNFSEKQITNLTINRIKYGPKPHAVIFDLSSTLIDSQQLDREALNHVLSLYKKPIWAETRKKRDASKSIKDNFPNFFGDDADEAYQTYIKYLLSNKNRMCLFDGALDTLKLLKASGVKTIIISNRDKEFVENILKEYKLEEYVSVAIGAGDTSYNKPSKELVQYALKKAGVEADSDRIIFVGDALADMNCAEVSQTIPALMRMCQTDVTDEWIIQRKKDQRPFWVMNNHKEFQKLIISGRYNQMTASIGRHTNKFNKAS